jgi:hypothetical protein
MLNWLMILNFCIGFFRNTGSSNILAYFSLEGFLASRAWDIKNVSPFLVSRAASNNLEIGFLSLVLVGLRSWIRRGETEVELDSLPIDLYLVAVFDYQRAFS